jgi:hypothetical protein
VFLAIVLLSPGGVVGMFTTATRWVRQRLVTDGTPTPVIESAPAPPVPVASDRQSI